MIAIRQSVQIAVTAILPATRPINLLTIRFSLAALLLPVIIIIAIAGRLQSAAVVVTDTWYDLRDAGRLFFDVLFYLPIPYNA